MLQPDIFSEIFGLREVGGKCFMFGECIDIQNNFFLP